MFAAQAETAVAYTVQMLSASYLVFQRSGQAYGAPAVPAKLLRQNSSVCLEFKKSHVSSRKVKLSTPNILEEFSNFRTQPLPPHPGLPGPSGTRTHDLYI